jgi:hypothetical protein
VMAACDPKLGARTNFSPAVTLQQFMILQADGASSRAPSAPPHGP